MVLWDLFAKQDYHALHHYLFFYQLHLAETKVIGKLAERYKQDKGISIQNDLDTGNISIPVIDAQGNPEFDLMITDKTVVNIFLAESGDFVPDLDVEGRQSRTTFEKDSEGNITIVNIIVASKKSIETLPDVQVIDLILGPFFHLIVIKNQSEAIYKNSSESIKIWMNEGSLANTAAKEPDPHFIIDDTP